MKSIFCNVIASPGGYNLIRSENQHAINYLSLKINKVMTIYLVLI